MLLTQIGRFTRDENAICFSSTVIPSAVRLCATSDGWSWLQEGWQDGSDRVEVCVCMLMNQWTFYCLFQSRGHRFNSPVAILPLRNDSVTLYDGRMDSACELTWQLLLLNYYYYFFRSTPKSRPNNMGLRCLSVRPSTKSFFLIPMKFDM